MKKQVRRFSIIVCSILLVSIVALLTSCKKTNVVSDLDFLDAETSEAENGLSYNYAYIGKFPQTVVSDELTINALNDLKVSKSSGFYEYENNEYVKLVASPYALDYTFINKSVINKGQSYYFKVEPIKWRIISSSSSSYQLLSEYLLFSDSYSSTPASYSESSIRQYLNDTFYNSVFTEDEKAYINLTTLEDTATSDYVYLLSNKDYTNKKYGFTTSNASTNTRYSISTDYARASGAYLNFDETYNGTGNYWCRQSGTTQPSFIARIGFDGSTSSDLASHSNYKTVCVRMALTIKPLTSK
ncbi:MAG: DUF6273 domain-containing protein [Acholeplasmatales bacterium]|jgi:hypothetical protein|nr:DUF6273 domain-containing protein [Acholeplasmatales bacterium]